MSSLLKIVKIFQKQIIEPIKRLSGGVTRYDIVMYGISKIDYISTSLGGKPNQKMTHIDYKNYI